MKQTVFSLLLIFISAVSTNAQQKRQKVDGIAAIVGNEIVLDSEVKQLKQQLQQQGLKNQDFNDCDILETLMQDKILLLEAKKDTTITVTDAEIENTVDQQLEYMKAQLGSLEKVLEFYNKKTLNELKNELEKVNKEKKLSQLMRNKVIKDVDINPEEVKNYFDKIPKDKIPEIGTKMEIYQIIIKPKPSKESEEAVINRLKEIKKQVENGSSFRAQAILYSEDPGSRNNGGKYVLKRNSPFVQEFKDIAFSLDEGQVSEPFKTEFGWHILFVEEIKGQERVVRHILLKPEIGFLEQRAAEKKLDTIRKRILDKELTFEEAAKEFSEDEETKKLGGKIVNPQTGESMLEVTMLDPALHQIVQNMKEGEITPVMEEEDRTGGKIYKIIMIKKRVDAHPMDFNKDYEKIKEMALEQKKEKILVDWINDKVKNNYIKVNPPYISCKFKSKWIK
jgi:peptidyl-prolyl cis-trans isomerase SurA